MKVKKRITKKRLKQPDEFLSFTEQSYLFIGKHIRKIGFFLILILMILSSLYLFRMWNQKKEDEANQKFILLLETYQVLSSPYRESSAADYKKTLEGFEELLKAYPHTTAGKTSLIYKGGIHLRLGEFDEAIRTYEASLKKAGKERLYRFLSLEGLGYAHEGKREYEKAVAAYQEIIRSDDQYDWTGVRLNLARCYEKMGKKEEALENYRAFLKTSPKSITTNSVLKKISLLEK